MLEIKNLTKIYKTKNGEDVLALDNVSLRFQKTGLVFLLGKSGSGKSTLLNLIGGLDEPTEGEVIVMGKSSKEFSASDFDSYRNTYIGFIFQEYNILNEFNVEDNIALALELQGRKKDHDLVLDILRQVELGNYAKRKPNTLSGGQKQRIAIARALVKDPQIIMADEPTGALDSKTGTQVFETLKRLSQTRLVLVVSHDREFAMRYGDRIIELSDGKVISDVSKTLEHPEVISDSAIKQGESTITIKKGAVLDDALIHSIANILQNSDGDVIISGGSEEVKNFKLINRIDDNGARERFAATPDIAPEQSEKAKFIRSRLPLGKAVKIGASSLKLKPMRLVFTILLTFISFMMFGLFSTLMLYNGENVMKSSFLSSDYSYLTIDKQSVGRLNEDKNELTAYFAAKFTPAELESFGPVSFGAYATATSSVGTIRPLNISISPELSNYYIPIIAKLAEMPENFSAPFTGDRPTGENEIAVSSYLAECALNSSFYTISTDASMGTLGEKLDLNEPTDIIGKYLLIFGKPAKVTGIFQSGEIPVNYLALKESNGDQNYLTVMMYQMFIEEGLHSLAFVSPDIMKTFLNDYAQKENIRYFEYSTNFYSFSYQGAGETYDILQTSQLNAYPVRRMLPITFFKELDELSDNEVIVPFSAIENYVLIKYDELNGKAQAAEDHDEFYAAHREEFDLFGDLLNNLAILQGEMRDPESGEMRDPAEEEINAAAQFVKSYMIREPLTVTVFADDVSKGAVDVVGAYYQSDQVDNGFYCSQNFFDNASVNESYSSRFETKYKPEIDATYDCILTSYDGSEDALDAVLSRLNTVDPQTDIVYSMDNVLYYQVTIANTTVDALGKVFLWTGIVLAVFSSLLLFNFISMSIANKKREIGILRAVGARGTDVFKIFFSESIIIVGICIVLSLLGTLALANSINSVLRGQVGLNVTLFVFGPLSALLMLCVALVVAFVSTFLPVFFAARKKPVDSIRAL